VKELGSAALAAALLTVLYACGAAIYGAVSGDRRFVVSARRAMYATAGLLTTCVVVLEAAFARDDFSFKLVADHSSTTTPGFYKLTAMWSSQEGSLLLWAFVLSLAASGVLYLTRNRHREIVPWATAVLAAIGAFFIGLMLFAAPPFSELSPAPVEGVGLTPLLRNPYMVIHPPMLYSGYVLFSIPFAFAIGALITRRLDASWIRTTRRFALVAWVFLAVGLLLGSRWSYEELGWGGYWAWDPVENAALMPWLMSTAFLHSIMVQERRGMLKTWNVSLIVATFCLALLGTFLVRSGILQSIHAFGASTVGGPLLVLIGVVAIGSTILIVSRRKDLAPERRIESIASREAIFLVNNLLLVGLVVVIFWGTMFPLIAEAVTGETSSLGAPWFDRYVTPIAVALVLFTGIGPLLAWGKLSRDAARRLLLWPVLGAVGTVVALFAFGEAKGFWAVLLFAFAAFALVALAQEFGRAGSARRTLTGEAAPTALGRAVMRNRRRYGGYVAHIGIAVLLIGVAASSSYQTSRDLRLDVGESAQVGDYTLTYKKLAADPANERIAFTATLDVQKNGKHYALLSPARNYYPTQDPSAGPIGRYFEGEATSEVGLRAGPGGDLWTAFQPNLSPLDADIARGNKQLANTGPVAQGIAIQFLAQNYAANPPPATFRVNVNPLVIWVWIGALISVVGGFFSAWPSAEGRRRVRAAYAARVGRELSGA
jgi:cytochrome c-type biogenesis protein CcmF